MSLAAWKGFGWLTTHQASRDELRDLLSAVERDLKSSAADGLDPDWAMTIAYNAALQVGAAALAASGYRAARDQHHYRIIQSLPHTLKVDERIVTKLDRFRKKRNEAAYERAGVASEGDARAMKELAITLRDDLLAWLRKHHPELM